MRTVQLEQDKNVNNAAAQAVDAVKAHLSGFIWFFPSFAYQGIRCQHNEAPPKLSFFPVSVIFGAVGEVIPSLGGLQGQHNIDWWLTVAARAGSC